MAMTEIDEAELVSLRTNNNLLAVAMANPKAREQVLRGLKTAKPDLPIPELDAKEPVLEELRNFGKSITELRDEFKADKEARSDAERMGKLQALWADGRQKASKEGYAGESLQALEKFMEENGVASHEIAIPAFERLHPAPAPVANSTGKFDFFARKADDNDKTMKMLWDGDSDGFLNNAIGDTLKQMRGAA